MRAQDGNGSARSLAAPVADQAELGRIAHGLLDELLPVAQPVRLVGLTLSALEEDEPPAPAALARGQTELPF